MDAIFLDQLARRVDGARRVGAVVVLDEADAERQAGVGGGAFLHQVDGGHRAGGDGRGAARDRADHADPQFGPVVGLRGRGQEQARAREAGQQGVESAHL
ncbi:hypothetical protein WJ970_21890 [Achromobacter xylosoxidans]